MTNQLYRGNGFPRVLTAPAHSTPAETMKTFIALCLLALAPLSRAEEKNLVWTRLPETPYYQPWSAMRTPSITVARPPGMRIATIWIVVELEPAHLPLPRVDPLLWLPSLTNRLETPKLKLERPDELPRLKGNFRSISLGDPDWRTKTSGPFTLLSYRF